MWGCDKGDTGYIPDIYGNGVYVYSDELRDVGV